MRAFRITLCFLTGLTVFAQTPAQDWRFAHPGATLIGGLRVKAILDSPLVNTLISQATAKDPSSGLVVGMIKGSLGGVSEVRFSVRDMGKGKDPDVLALVTGSLDDTAAAAWQGKASIHRIDANTFLIGQGQSIADAVSRLGKPATALQARAFDRGKALANDDLWIAGTLPEMPMTIPMLDSVRGLALGISAQDDLRVELDLDTASAKAAEDLVSSARKARTQQPALGAALQSEAEGSTAKFRFVMEGKQLLQAVQQAIENNQAPSPLAAFLGQPSAATVPAFREDPKPKRDTIRIYGLDEGPREIKSEPRQ